MAIPFVAALSTARHPARVAGPWALIVMLGVGCGESPRRDRPVDCALVPGQKVYFGRRDVTFFHSDPVGSGTVRLEFEARLTVVRDPGVYVLTAAEIEEMARGRPSEEAAEIRRIRPVQAEPGELFARQRLITVTIDEGPHAGASVTFERYYVMPKPVRRLSP